VLVEDLISGSVSGSLHPSALTGAAKGSTLCVVLDKWRLVSESGERGIRLQRLLWLMDVYNTVIFSLLTFFIFVSLPWIERRSGGVS
jgi:hypothetical protein